MTKCVQCNQPIDAGQQYIEVRQMPDEAGGLSSFTSAWAHWPTCPSKVVVRDGRYWLRFPSGDEVDMGAVIEQANHAETLNFRGLQT